MGHIDKIAGAHLNLLLGVEPRAPRRGTFEFLEDEQNARTLTAVVEADTVFLGVNPSNGGRREDGYGWMTRWLDEIVAIETVPDFMKTELEPEIVASVFDFRTMPGIVAPTEEIMRVSEVANLLLMARNFGQTAFQLHQSQLAYID